MAKKKQNTVLGCLTLLFSLVLGCILFSLLLPFISINPFLLFVICYCISAIFLRYFSSKNISKGHQTVLIILLCIALISRFFSTKETTKATSDQHLIDTKYISVDNDSIQVFSHYRNWKGFLGEKYFGEFNIRTRDYYHSKEFHKNIELQRNNGLWRDLYRKVVETDTPKLDLILNEFYSIYKRRQLNQREFAEMVVSFVQDIPYALVFQNECLAPEMYQEDIRQTLEDCPDCCIGNQKFGIQTPVEFLSNLKGDCDTRTILIYSILNYFGYDIAILNSDFYLHSIIGIAIPAKGTHKKYRGKNYYFWETTNKYYKIGEIPSHLSNTNHWYVALVNN